MRIKKQILIFPLIIFFALFTASYFFSLSIFEEIRDEFSSAINEYFLPNNPKYVKYQNENWDVTFDYPSHLEMSGGPSNDNMQYIIYLFDLENGDLEDLSTKIDDREMIGIRLFKNIDFEEEVERVGSDWSEFIIETQINGYNAVRVEEHVNPINEMKEEAIVLEKNEVVASIFIRWADNKDLKSFYDRVVNSFRLENN